MEERKVYKVELTERQKEGLDIFLSLMNDFECSNGGEHVELREIEQEDTKEDKFPRIGDNYYYLNGFGDVYHANYTNDAYDRDAIKIGNCFRTEEEAKFELERLKVIAEMKKFAELKYRDWDGWEPHYCIVYDYCKRELKIKYTTLRNHCEIYFETAEKGKECILSIGEDRIKVYYLGITRGND